MEFKKGECVEGLYRASQGAAQDYIPDLYVLCKGPHWELLSGNGPREKR